MIYYLNNLLKTIDDPFEYFPTEENKDINLEIIDCKDFHEFQDNYVSYCTKEFFRTAVREEDVGIFLQKIPKNCLMVSDSKIFLNYCNLIYSENPRYVFARIIENFQLKYIYNYIQKGENIRIGCNCIVTNCSIGNNVTLGDSVIIGGQGFGYLRSSDGIRTINFPHYGRVVIYDNVSIHSLTTIDRGSLSNTIIRENVKIDNHCHIAHNVVIGQNTMIAANVTISGGTKIGKNCWIGVGSTIIDRVTIADNTFIGSGSNVIKSILEPGGTWVGNPARRIK